MSGVLMWSMSTLLLLPMGFAQSVSSSTGSDSSHDTPWQTRIDEGVRRGEYAFQPVGAEENVWSAPNRPHEVRSRISRHGLEVFPRGANSDGIDAPWKLRLQTNRFGRLASLQQLGLPAIRAEGSQAHLDYGCLEEWFDNQPEGIKQGWTIRSRPNGTVPLCIGLELAGDLSFLIDDGSRSGTLLRNHGIVVLHYRHLAVFDATGRTLDAWLQETESGFAIIVDDEGACYPVTVDPILEGPSWVDEGDQANAHFGYSVASAGDVNGDGFGDVIVGAPFYDAGSLNEGRALVYSGSANGLATNASWIVESNEDLATFGSCVSSAGDVNDDGYGDVIIGAPGSTNGQLDEGRAFLYLGSRAGLSLTPSWTAESDQQEAGLGRCVAAAGDVNGDGFGDVVVGAPDYDSALDRTGRAYLYLGSASGLSSDPALILEGDQPSAVFGFSVRSAGDVNGDGYGDVILGSPIYDDGIYHGRAFLYLGSAAGLASTASWVAEGDQANADFGFFVATAGDVNGDGRDDVIIGSRYYDTSNVNAGRAYLFVGSVTGLDSTPAWTVEGDNTNAQFGYSGASAGDVNGDGFSDVVIAAPSSDSFGQIDAGRAFLYLGSTTGLGTTAAWTAEGEQQDAVFGFSVAGAGDVDGNGSSDVIIGAPNHSNGQTEEGRAYLYSSATRGRWYVDQDAIGLNDGGSWANAFPDLQSALAIAIPGDQIWVAEGSYKATADGNRAVSFQMKNGVAIYGGFAGNEAQLNQRDPALHATILTGDLLGNDQPGFVNYGDNSYHVVVANNVNLTSVLDGFEVRGGAADGSLSGNRRGGGIYIPSGSPAITGCRIEANLGYQGAGVYLGAGSPLITNCTIRQNLGRGLLLRGSPLLEGCTIQENNGRGIDVQGRIRATGCEVADNLDGGIYLFATIASIVDTDFLRNKTGFIGGGLVASSGNTSLLRCLFEGNASIAQGGGLLSNGTITVSRCVFVQNSAITSGGGVFAFGSPRLEACQFLNNSAATGGGMAFSSSSAEVVSCVVTGNQATNVGGGASVDGGAVAFANCTIVNNRALRGGGLVVTAGAPTVVNSIFWANQVFSNPGDGREIKVYGGASVAVRWTQILGGWPGTGNSNSNPRFKAPTNLHLSPTSPCIDSGNNTMVPSWSRVDLDHNLRFHDNPASPDTGVGTPPLVDRGAYEFGSTSACEADCDGDGICDEDEIATGGDTDLNGNGVPDGCDGKVVASVDQGESLILLPQGGGGDPTQEPVVEFTNGSGPDDAVVTVVQSDLDVHAGAGGYGALGKTVTIETSLQDGAFWMRVKIPFTAADLAGMAWYAVDLLSFDIATHNWELAPMRNTVNSPGHSTPTGDRFLDSGGTIPPLSSDLGDYGVYWNPITNAGFAWANVDHTTDFSGGVLFGTAQDCNENGIDDLEEIEAGAADCNLNGLLDVCELALGFARDCNGNGVLDFCELEAGSQADCNQNGVPDSCDIAMGSSRDRYPFGGDGIPDECQIGPWTAK